MGKMHQRWGRIEGWLGVLLVLAGFLTAGLLRYGNRQGEDLYSSYAGCRLMVTGQTSHLFAYDPVLFSAVGPDAAWRRVALGGGYYGGAHPYVQTPLWAYVLQPLCAHPGFKHFVHVFAVLLMLSFAGMLWLVARFWTPSFFHPVALGLVLLGLWFSEPFVYAMLLMQTHILFLLLGVAGLILAGRRRPLLAGLLVALAAAVKLTPIFLVVYWLARRRWAAAVAALVWSGALWLLTVGLTGWPLTAAYMAVLKRVSHVLLISQNSQSFAAWVMGRFYPRPEYLVLHSFPLPAALRIGSLLLLILFTVLGGLLDRARERSLAGMPLPPLGAGIALVAATIFAPIAWSHYFIVLVIPVMLLVEEARRRGSLGTPARYALLAATALAVALNFLPLSTDVVGSYLGRWSILRSQFDSGAICLLALTVAGWLSLRTKPELNRQIFARTTLPY